MYAVEVSPVAKFAEVVKGSVFLHLIMFLSTFPGNVKGNYKLASFCTLACTIFNL